MFCKNCGAECIEGTKFCVKCGAALSEPEIYQAPVQSNNNNSSVPGKGLGIASMVVGIVSLAFFCVFYIALPCAIVGISLGVVSANKARQACTKNSMANAGIICSAISIALTILFIFIIAIGITFSI